MKKTSLVIMAAGIGSRFGKGIKQLEPVGPCGEVIMDYSIHDALEAGFNKVIFVIRKDLEEDFKQMIGPRIDQKDSRNQKRERSPGGQGRRFSVQKMLFMNRLPSLMLMIIMEKNPL